MNYAYNDAGQLNGVTGSGYPGVTQFESGIQYRAWGGLKHVLYGSGRNLNIGYNSRLQMTSFAFSVNGTSISGSEFQYYADGRVKFSHDLGNPAFDRSYGYDHVGRLTLATTGTEARGGTVQDGPYHQSYHYDVWDNLLSRILPCTAIHFSAQDRKNTYGWVVFVEAALMDYHHFRACETLGEKAK